MNLAPDAPALRLERLVKDYALDWRGRTARALDGATFNVARGTVCALVGPNGPGKSTTLKLCAGLVRPTSGRCEVAGRSPGDAVRAGRAAYLPEETLLPDFDSARDFLRRLTALADLTPDAAEAAVENALARTGLAAVAPQRLTTLSKGQRQRLGLAQALLRAPEILLLDEPASGLDPRAHCELRALIAGLRAEGRTVVLSAHFLPHLDELCDQFVVLDRGRVVFNGDRAAVAERGGLERVHLEEASA